MTCTVSFIQQESQPANAVPSMLESVCESVVNESEADPLIRSMYKLCLSKIFFLAMPLQLVKPICVPRN